MAMFAGSKTLKELLAEHEWELPTSFIDVVFLLLLYFTLTMKFNTIEQRMQALLPRDGPAPVFKPVPPELEISVKAVDPAGRTPTFQVMDWRTNDPNALAGRMAQMAPSVRGQFRVVIDGAQGCPFRHVMSALDACARAGLTDVSFRPPLDGLRASGGEPVEPPVAAERPAAS